LPGGACTHWKAPPCHGAHPRRTITKLHLEIDIVIIQLRHFLRAAGRDEADHVRLHHAAGGINKNVYGNAQLAAWLDSSGKLVISGKNDTTMITVGVSDPATAMKLDMIAASLASVGTSRDEHKGSEKASADSSTKTMALIAIVVAAGVGLAEVLTKLHAG
jgi:hypothetical protein